MTVKISEVLKHVGRKTYFEERPGSTETVRQKEDRLKLNRVVRRVNDWSFQSFPKDDLIAVRSRIAECLRTATVGRELLEAMSAYVEENA